MNILVVCHYGLYQNLSFSFVHNQVREFVKSGHRVRVIIPNGWGKTGRNGKPIGKALHISQMDGVEMYDLRYLTLSCYGEKGFNTRRAIGAIGAHWKRIFRDFRPDVIHAHTLGFDSDIGAWLKNKWGCPLVVTTHGSDTFIPFDAGQRSMLKKYTVAANTVVCVSSLLRERLISCGVTVPMSVILNGFNVKYVETSGEKAPFSIIQAGYLIPRKKADITIRALAILQKKHPKFSLEIVGSGGEMERYKELCATLSLEDSVCFHGFLPNAETLLQMSASRFFVMPSVNEGFGIVYLEAMANGCITIGTEGEGIADLIVSGENGFLVPADDPDAIVQVIEWCLANPEKAAAIAERGRQAALALTWERNAQAYILLFEELINK